MKLIPKQIVFATSGPAFLMTALLALVAAPRVLADECSFALAGHMDGLKMVIRLDRASPKSAKAQEQLEYIEKQRSQGKADCEIKQKLFKAKKPQKANKPRKPEKHQ